MVLLLGLLAGVLVACGGGSKGDSADAQKLIHDTFASSKPLTSGRLTVEATIVPHGLSTDPGPIKISFGGPFDRGNGKTDVPTFAFTLAGELGGQTYSAGATSTGKAGYLSLQNDSYQLPASEYARLKKSFAQLQSVAQPKTTQGRLDWLSNPEIKGDADVAGVKTTHVAGTVDVAKLLNQVQRSRPSGRQLSSAQIAQVRDAIKNPRFDFYTGKSDHLLRRVTLAFDFAVPAAQRSQVGGLSSAGVTLNYQVADLNAPQSIPTPTNIKPISELGPKLQSLQQIVQSLSSGSLGGPSGSGASGSSGSSGSGSSGSSGATPSVSKQAQAYAKCLQDAGNDVAKQQKCASLLK